MKNLTRDIYEKYVDVILKPKEVYDRETILENQRKACGELTPEIRRAFRVEVLDFCSQYKIKAKLINKKRS